MSLAWKLPASEAPKAKPSVPAGRRIYAVGDIHGRADLLSDLLMRIDDDLKARPTADSVQVFLGDYIDRGPNSRQVIDLLIARRRRRDVLFLKGNHEDCALQFLSDPTVLSEWQNMGGLNTLLSYGVVPTRRDDPKLQHKVSTAFRQAMPDSHRRFIRRPRAVVCLWRLLFRPCWRAAGNTRYKSSPNRTCSGSAMTFSCTKRISAWSWCTAIHRSMSQIFDRTASISIPAHTRRVG